MGEPGPRRPAFPEPCCQELTSCFPLPAWLQGGRAQGEGYLLRLGTPRCPVGRWRRSSRSRLRPGDHRRGASEAMAHCVGLQRAPPTGLPLLQARAQHGCRDVNVNVQTAMRLAGHRNASTPMRYVMRTRRLAAPTAAPPTLRIRGSARALFAPPPPAPARIAKTPTAPRPSVEVPRCL